MAQFNFGIQPATFDSLTKETPQHLMGLAVKSAEHQRVLAAKDKKKHFFNKLHQASQVGDIDMINKMVANNPDYADQAMKMVGIYNDQQKKGKVDTAYQMLTGDPVAALEQSIAEIEARGGDSSHTRQALEAVLQNPAEAQRMAMSAIAMYGNKDQFTALKELRSGGNDEKFLEEERKFIRSGIDRLNKQASELTTNYGKLERLAPQVKLGNRQAAAGMIMSLARIMSPGIVTDTDFQAFSGNPMTYPAQALALVSSRDSEVGQMLSSFIDPTNPETFDVEGVLGAANAAIGAAAPSVFGQYDSYSSRADRAGLGDRQKNTLLGDRSVIDQLGVFMPKPVSWDNPPAGSKLVDDGKGNQAYLMPDGKFLLPDGSVVE